MFSRYLAPLSNNVNNSVDISNNISIGNSVNGVEIEQWLFGKDIER